VEVDKAYRRREGGETDAASARNLAVLPPSLPRPIRADGPDSPATKVAGVLGRAGWKWRQHLIVTAGRNGYARAMARSQQGGARRPGATVPGFQKQRELRMKDQRRLQQRRLVKPRDASGPPPTGKRQP
jgi:hypothetical protein